MARDVSGALFLRPTSGLTKYFGTWTSLFAVIGASVGTWQWVFVGTLQDMYPGINAGLTWGIGLVFMLIYNLMLTLMSIAMPRSAGLYQISARGFNPVAGILAVWRGIIANPIIKTSEFYLLLVFLGATFANWGAVTGDPALKALGVSFSAQSPMVLVSFSLIIMTVFALIAYLGPLFKVEPVIQMLGGLFSMIGWIMAIVVLLSTPASAVPGRWDAVWGAGAYQEVTTVATAAGFVPAAFSVQTTILATVWPIALVWPYLILLYGGEVSDPAKNLLITQLGGGVILTILLTLGAGLLQGTFGPFTSMYTVAAATGKLTQTGVFQGGLGTFTAVLAANPIVSGWILLSPVVIAITATPINMAWVTRGFFQAALDRMMPSFFGKLSRFHTPTYAILYWLVFGAPFTLAYAAGYGGFVAVVTSVIGLWGLEMIFQSCAALQLPYLKRPLYEGSIRKQPEIGGVPLVSILGIIILPTSLLVLIVFMQGVSFLSSISMLVQYGFSALWFVVFSERLKRKRIELAGIYESLPPD